MTFYFYRSHVNADGQRVYKNAAGQEVLAGNGYYDPRDSSIHIDLNAGDEGSAMLSTIAHELTHFIQDWSPEKYRTFCRILMEGYSDRGQSVKELVLAKQAKYRKELGIDLTYEQAYDEVIASSMESVLNDGNVMDLLDQLETADKTLWEKFCSFLEEIADLIRRTIDAFRGVHPESPEGRIVERMTEIHAQLQQAFAEGLHEGGENYRTGGQKNTAESSGVKYSYAQLSAEDRKSGELVADFINTVNLMMDSAKKSKRKKKIGIVSKNHADIINTLMQPINPSFSAEGYELWIDGTGAAHIEERHGIKGTADHTMAAYEAKVLIPWASQNATTGSFLYDTNGNIRLSTRYFNSDKSRAPEIRLEKALGEDVVYISECVPDSNNKRIWITSAYIKKGSRGQLLNMEGEPSPQHTPKASFDSTATNLIIATDDETVKKFSARYQQNESAAQLLREENAGMTEDVAGLNELLALQRKQNGAKLRTASLAEAAAYLVKTAGNGYELRR